MMESSGQATVNGGPAMTSTATVVSRNTACVISCGQQTTVASRLGPAGMGRVTARGNKPVTSLEARLGPHNRPGAKGKWPRITQTNLPTGSATGSVSVSSFPVAPSSTFMKTLQSQSSNVGVESHSNSAQISQCFNSIGTNRDTNIRISSNMLTNNFAESKQFQTSQPTSNALAQLARLSSRLPLPETAPFSKPSPFERPHQSDSIDNSQSFYDDQSSSNVYGCKRSRRSSGPGGIARSYQCDDYSKKASKESVASTSFPTYSNINITNTHPSPSVSKVSTPPNSIDFKCETQSPSWIGLLHYIQQLIEHKESQRGVQPQDILSYNLARSFLDYFYGKLMSQFGSCSESASSRFHTSDNSKQNNELEDKRLMSNGILEQTATCEDQRTTMLSNNHTENTPPVLRPSTGLKCCLCGKESSTQEELCIHTYSHLMNFEIEKHNSTYIKIPSPVISSYCPKVPNVQTYSTHFAAGLESRSPNRSAFDNTSLDQAYTSHDSHVLGHSNSQHPEILNLEKMDFNESAINRPIPPNHELKSMEASFQAYWMSMLNHYWQNYAMSKQPDLQTSWSNQSSQPNLQTSTSTMPMWSQFLPPLFNSINPYTSLFPKV